MAPAVKYAPLEVQQHGTDGSPIVVEAYWWERCFPLLPAAQVATCFLPVAFSDAVLAQQLGPLVQEVTGNQDDPIFPLSLLVAAAPLLLPATGLLLSVPCGAIAERCGHTCCGGHYRSLIVIGMCLAALGLLLLTSTHELQAYFFMDSLQEPKLWPTALALGVGTLLICIAHTSLVVALRARLAAGVQTSRLGDVFSMAALFEILGSALGTLAGRAQWQSLGYFSSFATEACDLSSLCFNVRTCMFFSGLLMLLGGSLTMMAGSQESKKGRKISPSSTLRPNTNSIEMVLEDPGARTLLLASLLSSGSWALVFHSQGIVAKADTLQTGLILQVILSAALALAVPRLLEGLGGFRVWLLGNLSLALLLLFGWLVQRTGWRPLVLLWLASLGSVWTVQLVVPYAIMARRARARAMPLAVAMAAATVPKYAAQLCWTQGSSQLLELLGVSAGLFGLGALLAVWAAVVCSYAVACDTDCLAADSVDEAEDQDQGASFKAASADAAVASSRHTAAPRPRRRAASP